MSHRACSINICLSDGARFLGKSRMGVNYTPAFY